MIHLLPQGLQPGRPKGPMGATFEYSHIGYVVAGAILEEKFGESWESLIHTRLFEPLKLQTAGFGAPGRQGAIDQPVALRLGLMCFAIVMEETYTSSAACGHDLGILAAGSEADSHQQHRDASCPDFRRRLPDCLRSRRAIDSRGAKVDKDHGQKGCEASDGRASQGLRSAIGKRRWCARDRNGRLRRVAKSKTHGQCQCPH
jgi:hypothetical protein